MRQLERKIRTHVSGITTVLRRVSFIPDDGLHISRSVKKIKFFEYCGYFVGNKNLQQLRGLFAKVLSLVPAKTVF